MPNIIFDSLDLVPDEFKAVAKAVDGTDGKMAINVVPTTKIDEFRDKNIALSKDKDGLIAKLKPLEDIVGADVEGFGKTLEELRATHQRVKDGELKETRAVEEALNKRTDEMRNGYEGRIQTLSKEGTAWRAKFDALEQQFKRSQIASSIKDACMDAESGVEPKAINHLITTAYDTFVVDDHGKVVPMDGSATIYGSDGVSPMTPKEWLNKQKEVNPFFFKGSSGGGAGGETTKKVLGVDAKQLSQMTAVERLRLANDPKNRRVS